LLLLGHIVFIGRNIKIILKSHVNLYLLGEHSMNWEQVKAIIGQVAIITAGVLVANQVQRMLDKSKLLKPKEA
jgi:hypothetical protein